MDEEEPTLVIASRDLERLLERQQGVVRESIAAVDLALNPAGEDGAAGLESARAAAAPKRRGWFGAGGGSEADAPPPPSSPAELILRQLPEGQRQALAGTVAWALRANARDGADRGLPLAAWPLGQLAGGSDAAPEREWAEGVLEQVVLQFLGLRPDHLRGLLPLVSEAGRSSAPSSGEGALARPGQSVTRFVVPLVPVERQGRFAPPEGWLRGAGAVPEEAARRLARKCGGPGYTVADEAAAASALAAAAGARGAPVAAAAATPSAPAGLSPPGPAGSAAASAPVPARTSTDAALREAAAAALPPGSLCPFSAELPEGRARWRVVVLLLAAFVMAPSGSSGGVGTAGYDARVRATVRRLAAMLGVRWRAVAAAEEALASRFAVAALGAEADKAKLRSASRNRWILMGGAAVVGAALLVVSGGLAAPGVAAGMGAIGAALGGAAGAALVSAGAWMTSAVGYAVIVSLFGAAGTSIASHRMGRRTAGLETFRFRRLTVVRATPLSDADGPSEGEGAAAKDAAAVGETEPAAGSKPGGGGVAGAVGGSVRAVGGMARALGGAVRSATVGKASGGAGKGGGAKADGEAAGEKDGDGAATTDAAAAAAAVSAASQTVGSGGMHVTVCVAGLLDRGLHGDHDVDFVQPWGGVGNAAVVGPTLGAILGDEFGAEADTGAAEAAGAEGDKAEAAAEASAALEAGGSARPDRSFLPLLRGPMDGEAEAGSGWWSWSSSKPGPAPTEAEAAAGKVPVTGAGKGGAAPPPDAPSGPGDAAAEDGPADEAVAAAPSKEATVAAAAAGAEAQTHARSGWLRSSMHPGDAYALVWEPTVLMALQHSIEKFVSSAIMSKATSEVLQQTVLKGLLAAWTYPSWCLSALSFIDSPWSLALDRAAKAGKALADVIESREHGKRPVTLLGYSVGARVVFEACLELHRRREARAAKRGGAPDPSDPASAVVDNVVLIGAPVSAAPAAWRGVRSIAAGRVINAYVPHDLVLRFVFRANTLAWHVAGTGPVGVTDSSALRRKTEAGDDVEPTVGSSDDDGAAVEAATEGTPDGPGAAGAAADVEARQGAGPAGDETAEEGVADEDEAEAEDDEASTPLLLRGVIVDGVESIDVSPLVHSWNYAGSLEQVLACVGLDEW